MVTASSRTKTCVPSTLSAGFGWVGEAASVMKSTRRPGVPITSCGPESASNVSEITPESVVRWAFIACALTGE